MRSPRVPTRLFPSKSWCGLVLSAIALLPISSKSSYIFCTRYNTRNLWFQSLYMVVPCTFLFQVLIWFYILFRWEDCLDQPILDITIRWKTQIATIIWWEEWPHFFLIQNYDSWVTGIEGLHVIVLFNMFCDEVSFVSYGYMMCFMTKILCSRTMSILGYLRHYSWLWINFV